MAAATDAGVGEEDVDRTVVTLGLSDQMADIGFLGDVARDREAFDIPCHRVQAAAIAIGHHHALGALLGIAPRDRLADAAGRTGDDADLVFDLHPSLPFRRPERSPEAAKSRGALGGTSV